MAEVDHEINNHKSGSLEPALWMIGNYDRTLEVVELMRATDHAGRWLDVVLVRAKLAHTKMRTELASGIDDTQVVHRWSSIEEVLFFVVSPPVQCIQHGFCRAWP